jgi:hypothetical protein
LLFDEEREGVEIAAVELDRAIVGKEAPFLRVEDKPFKGETRSHRSGGHFLDHAPNRTHAPGKSQ